MRLCSCLVWLINQSGPRLGTQNETGLDRPQLLEWEMLWEILVERERNGGKLDILLVRRLPYLRDA